MQCSFTARHLYLITMLSLELGVLHGVLPAHDRSTANIVLVSLATLFSYLVVVADNEVLSSRATSNDSVPTATHKVPGQTSP